VVIVPSYELAMPTTQGMSGRPAHYGEYLAIFANGFGETDTVIPVGTPAPLDHLVYLKDKVHVYIGGIEVDPTFAGLAPGQIGLYQINVAVPTGAPTGPSVPLRLETVLSDGTVLTSNEVTIALDGPGAAK
jgi:uncharacterized protein (TIGR03437 family)